MADLSGSGRPGFAGAAACLSAGAVFFPTLPSTTRPLAAWKGRTAASVSLPCLPVDPVAGRAEVEAERLQQPLILQRLHGMSPGMKKARRNSPAVNDVLRIRSRREL
jgi:hypothetical protein